MRHYQTLSHLAFQHSISYFKQTTDYPTFSDLQHLMERAGPAIREEDHTIEATPSSPGLHENAVPRNNPAQAKQYSLTKLFVNLLNTVLFLVLILLLLGTGLTTRLELLLRTMVEHDYLVLLGFTLVLGVGEGLIGFPLKMYSGFLLEHRYGLSNQTLTRWFLEEFKGSLIGAALTVPVLLALFWCLRNFKDLWWLPVGILLFLLSVVLARLAPVLLFPLFYKFKPLHESTLKEHVVALCEKVGMRVSGVFVFDMSKNTKKANAAFTGIGKSRRIILGDTLIANFTDEEIETVVAHELGHYKLRHLRTMIVTGTLSTFAGLYLTAQLYSVSLDWFGFSGGDTIAALPLLGLWLAVYSFVTTPLGNIISRAHERAADYFAVQLTGKKQAFTNALTKLGRINLADTTPHPLVEFLFHSHPSIERRIRSLEAMQAP